MKLIVEEKTVFKVDYTDFDEFVDHHYGYGFEFCCHTDVSNPSSHRFNVSNDYVGVSESAGKEIRNGNYDRCSIHQILYCLHEDGLIQEGEYIINVEW